MKRGREQVANLNQEDLIRFVAKVKMLRSEGISVGAISERLGVSPNTIWDRVRRVEEVKA